MFPKISGSNLAGRKFSLPGDLEGDLNLLFLPFQQWQQMQVDSWIPAVKALTQRYPRMRFYELPSLPRFDPLRRWFIDSGMRVGIPNEDTRAITITLYTDLDAYCRALDISSLDEMHLMLINRSGMFHWRTSGAYTAEKADELSQVLGSLLTE
jgi:hypothetical protein